VATLRLAAALSIAAAVVAAGDGAARADETGAPFRASVGPFGETGQWAYSITSPDEFPFYMTKTGGGDWNWAVRPGADTFIARNVSVGGILSLTGNGSSNDVGIGGRAGYNAVISSVVSVWIRGGLFYHHYSANDGTKGSDTILELKVPFLFHVIPHVLVGLGPTFQQPFQRSNGQPKDATFGLTALIGAYI
jgi:hypothetical protein